MDKTIEPSELSNHSGSKIKEKTNSERYSILDDVELTAPQDVKYSPYDPPISRKLMERITGLSVPTLLKYEQDGVIHPSRTKLRGVEQVMYRVSDVQSALKKRGVKFKNKKEAEVIAIFSQKGGVGKSSFSQHLSSMLSLVGKVLVIDLDAQSDASTLLGIDPIYTDIVEDDAKLEPTIAELITWNLEKDIHCDYKKLPFEQVVKKVTDSLHVIPSDLDLGEINYAINTYPFVEKVMPDGEKMPGKLFLIRGVIEEIKKSQDYDFILFDCPPNIEILNLNALISANRIVIPLELEAKCLNIMRRNRQWLKKVAGFGEALGFSWDKILIVPNKFKKENIKLKALAKLQDIYANDNYLHLSHIVVPNAAIIDQCSASREPVLAVAMKQGKDAKTESVRRAKEFTDIFWSMMHEILDLPVDRLIFDEAFAEE
jgi:cellulose biosynthesis protein BcsQ